MLASLTRHKLIVLLMVVTTALSSAVVTNIAVMIVDRLALLHSPSGINESGLVTINSSSLSDAQIDSPGSHQGRLGQYQADVVALRGIDGVNSATTVSGLPFEGGIGLDISDAPDAGDAGAFQATAFTGSVDMLKTLGLRLTQGRDFLDSEYVPLGGADSLNKVSSAIVSRALADRLFHTSNVVGRLFYASGHPIRIVGIVDHLMGMSPELGAVDNEYAMLLPLQPDGAEVTFAMSTLPKSRGRVLRRAVELLSGRDPTRILDNAKSFSQIRADYFQGNDSMVSLLLTAAFILLAVTVAGLMGLISFWVQQRTRSTGIRRALGARRIDVFFHFLIENFLIVSGGVLLGCLLAYALNLVLVEYYEVRVLPWTYFFVGAITLWIAGQIAGLSPALRAASVPPAVATRSL